ncbi:hypothetical protein KQ299_11515 [Synechococcus sp. CS-603]|nr:hypothetical protein [Synechococcus sp. CS-603]
MGIALATAGCSGGQLPPCVQVRADVQEAKITPPSQQALIGIDGSGSMAGFLSGGGDGEDWKRLLRAIKLTAGEFKSTETYRIGGSKSTTMGAIDEAAEPCYFGGCAGVPSVASSLDTLWTLPQQTGPVPLRVMVSDLEVNQGDISALRGAIGADLRRGASIGILGLRLPFEGTVFDSNAKRIHDGKANRPLYLLATGSRGAVESFLAGVRQTLALSGFKGPIESSLLGGKTATLKAATAWGEPRASASSGLPIRISGTTYGPSGNADYQLVKLLPTAAGLVVSSSKGLVASSVAAGSAAPADLMTISPLALAGASREPSAEGVTVTELSVIGGELVARFTVAPGTPGGAFRGTVKAGSLPEQWWLTWNRGPAAAGKAKDQTDNLLLTLTSLSQAVVPAGSPPAAAFCVAFTT